MAQTVNAKELRQKFVDLGMPRMVRIVDFLETRRGRQILEFGSSSIGPRGDGQMYIGNPKANPPVKPIEAIAHSATFMHELSPEERAQFDEIMGAMAESMTRINSFPYKVKRAPRAFLIKLMERLGLRISDELLMGVNGWWKPWPRRRRRKQVDVEAYLKSL